MSVNSTRRRGTGFVALLAAAVLGLAACDGTVPLPSFERPSIEIPSFEIPSLDPVARSANEAT